MNKKPNRRHLINKKVLYRKAKESNIVKHAIRELTIAGYFNDISGMNKWMREKVIELLTVFSSHGHSGNSAPFTIDLFKKLASFNVISPLTFKDDEWDLIDSDENDITWQNNRKSTIFKSANGDIYDIYAYSKSYIKKWIFGNNEWVNVYDDITYNGGILFEVENDICTGRIFNKCTINTYNYYLYNGYIPIKTRILKCKEIEISPENYISVIDSNETNLILLSCDYKIHWHTCNHIKGKLCTSITDEDKKIVINELINTK